MRGHEIQIPREDARPMPGYAALPESADRGVVVIHEILGRQPEIDRVVERFGEAGYGAVGPDLFYEGSKLGCIRRSLATMSSGGGPIADRVDDAKHWLASQSKLDPSRIGVIGFCLGGGLALALGSGFAGVSTNYGDLPPDDLLREVPPTIACYGGRDRLFGRHGEKLRGRMAGLGLDEPEVHSFPDVGHSFLTDGDHPLLNTLTWPLFEIRWNAEVAEEGWSKIMAFFDRTL